jgi:hypothetical protein
MNFLRKLFGGSATRPDTALYFYIQPKMCQEVMQIRVDAINHPSLADDGESYILRKMVSGTRCPFQAEITLRFDKNRNIIEQTIENGKFVTVDEYNTFVEKNAAPKA